MRSALYLPQKGPLKYEMEQDSLLTPTAPDRASHILTVAVGSVCLTYRGQDTWSFYMGCANWRDRVCNKMPKKHPLKPTKLYYLLNMALRDLLLSKVLIDKKQSEDVAYAAIEHFVWCMGINLI